MKKIKIVGLLVALCGVFLMSSPGVSQAKQSGFVKKSGKCYYYSGNKKVKGLKKIKGKYRTRIFKN